MAGTFGSQFAEQQAQQQQRVSRTQRKAGAEQERIAQYNFSQWSKEADRLRTEVFVDKQVEEKYYIEVPREYVDRYGNISSAWDRKSDNEKNSILRNTSDRNKIRFERARTVTDPFTFEEYGQEYSKLDPNIQQFFLSPTQITDAQNKEKQNQRDQLQSKIDAYQLRVQSAQQRILDYQNWWNNLDSRSKDKRRDDYHEGLDDRERDLEEYQDAIRYAQGEAGKIDQGATANDIWNYAQDKADYDRQRREARSKSIKQFNESVKTGNMDATLLKLGLSKSNVSYDKYVGAVTKYNQNVDYLNQLKSWASKSGYVNLPDWAKAKINPSATEWQGSNPSEKLIFDKSGNVTGIESGKLQQTVSIDKYSNALNKQFETQNPSEKLQIDAQGNVTGIKSGMFGGKTFSVTEYQSKVQEYNDYYKQSNAEAQRQQKLTEDAKKYLADTGFVANVEKTNLEKPKENLLQQAWSGLKTLYFASPFGTSFDVSETQQKELTALREQRVREALTPKLSPLGVFDLTKFSTLPLDKSWKAVEYQEQLDYKGKEAGRLLNELNALASGGGRTDFNPELKPFIEAEGLNILKNKGVGITETKQFDIANADKYGNIPSSSTLTLTDEAFSRKISQNMLEWENERKNAPTIKMKIPIYTSGTGIFNPETKQFDAQTMEVEYKGLTVGQVFLGTRIISTKALETYGLMKGAEFVIGGSIKLAKGTYDIMGGGLKAEKVWQTGTFSGKALVSESNLIPKFLTEKTIQLAEGSAIVPRTYGWAKTGLGLGLTGVYGFAKYKQYQSYKATSPYGAEVFWLETSGELAGIEASTHIAQRTYNKAMNRIENWNLKTRTQADISQQGFWRKNPQVAGDMEKVYMNRANPLKLSDTKTWNLKGLKQSLQGYSKGEFVGRAYKYLPDEVTAYYKYGGDVQVFDKGGKLVKVLRTPTEWELQKWSEIGSNVFENKGQMVYRGRNKVTGEFKTVDLVKNTQKADKQLIRELKAEAFPYDNAKTHLKWFMRRNIQEYGVGTYSELPIKVKGKAFGYSATGQEWTATEFKPSDIFYVDKAGTIRTIKTEGAIQYVSGKGVSAGFLRIFSKSAEESAVGKSASSPIIYADYFDKVKLNKAIKEVRGIDDAGRELKAYIYKNKAFANELNIGGMKREVEGTVEITSRIPVRRAFAIKLEGWKVPIEEQVFGKVEDLSPNDLRSIIKSMGSVKQLFGIQQSSLPSKVSTSSAMFSSVNYASPSKSVSKSVSSAMSDVISMSNISNISRVSSKISDLSKISAPSRVSRSPELSYSNLVSDIMSRVSRSSRTEFPRSPSKFKTPLIELGLEGKEKLKRKLKKDLNLFGELPDFTARAVGLAPTKVKSVKDALREMSKIKTGFEIRKGLSFGGSDKNIMRGIPQ